MAESLTEQISRIVPRLEGWCSITKALEMARCVRNRRPAVCVEIGVFGGRSLLPLAMACRHLNHGHVYGIDAWAQSSALEGLDDPQAIDYWSKIDLESIYRGCVHAVLDLELSPYCTLIRQCSQQSACQFREIDLLHIDGNHDREQSLSDVEQFLPLVVDGGDIWFDDADWQSTQDAVRRLRDECRLVRDYGNVIHVRKQTPRSSATLHTERDPGQRAAETLADARRLIVTADHPQLKEYPGGIYNPGAIEHQGRILLLARNEKYTEHERRDTSLLSLNSCRPVAIELDDARPDELTVAALYPLEMPAEYRETRTEDFRLFQFRGQHFAGCSVVRTADQIEYAVLPVDWAAKRLLSPIRPRLDFALQRVEKNWCFFECKGTLYLLYSFQPYHLLRLADEGDFRFETVVRGTLTIRDAAHDLRSHSFVSMSTSPVEFEGELLIFVHCRDRDRNYRNYAVLIDAESLQPNRISATPFFCGGDASGLSPNVVYLMSVLRRRQSLICFFGEGDYHVSSATMTETEVRSRLVNAAPVTVHRLTSESVVGEYDYEHCGLFRRPIGLMADGTIHNGGQHDSAWQIEFTSQDVAILILGNDGLSCRLNPDGDDSWSGRWLRGACPEVVLTKSGP